MIKSTNIIWIFLQLNASHLLTGFLNEDKELASPIFIKKQSERTQIIYLETRPFLDSNLSNYKKNQIREEKTINNNLPEKTSLKIFIFR